MLTTVTARAVRPHGVTTPLPDGGWVELTPAVRAIVGGAFQAVETIRVPIVDGAISKPITPGYWKVRVCPAHGSPWSTFQVEVPAQDEPFDLATAAPVAVIDGVAMTRGEPGRGIDFIGNADAEGWATVVWTDGTTTQMRVPTVTLTAEERAVLDGVLAQAREAEQDAQRAESAAGTAMGHASAAADARDAARAAAGDAAAVLQETRAALAAGEMTGPQGERGPTGPAGPAGPQGERGPEGPQGVQGPTGATGAQGTTGPASTVPGPQGPTGPKGDQGPKGDAGPTGPQGAKGDTGAQGATGPAGKDATPPAFTASATALAATAQPTASISGTYPNLALALGIPAGGGEGGGGTITAAGRPDVASTMDADTQARVTAAPSGTLFSSTDRPQGAAVWQKQGTAWVCVVGDTGWYQYNVPFITEGGVWLRRTQAGCMVTASGGIRDVAGFSNLVVGGLTWSGTHQLIPQGWRTKAPAIVSITDDGGPWVGNLFLSGTGDSSYISVRGATKANVPLGRLPIGLYAPSDPWPTSITGIKHS